MNYDLFMGNNPREKSIYMSGFTWGVGFAGTLLGLVLIFIVNDTYTSGLIGFTALTMGIAMIVVSFIWRKRANK